MMEKKFKKCIFFFFFGQVINIKSNCKVVLNTWKIDLPRGILFLVYTFVFSDKRKRMFFNYILKKKFFFFFCHGTERISRVKSFSMLHIDFLFFFIFNSSFIEINWNSWTTMIYFITYVYFYCHKKNIFFFFVFWSIDNWYISWRSDYMRGIYASRQMFIRVTYYQESWLKI